MRIVDVGIPAFGALVAIFSVASFKITEERSYEIRSELEKRRNKSIKVEKIAPNS
jgi:Na+/melibiose symporter-like transporter